MKKYVVYTPGGPTLSLYATGNSNWDLYQDTDGYLYSIAKPGSGAKNSCFGYPRHLDRLERSGINHGYIKEEGI